MLYRLSFIILFAILIGCNQPPVTNKNLFMGLHGNVKSLKELSYKAVEKFGKVEKDVRQRENVSDKDFYLYFDKQGNIVEKHLFEIPERPTHKFFYKYNEQNQLVEINSIKSDTIPSLVWIYKYNDKGKKTEEYCHEANGSFLNKISYKYDGNDNISEAIVHSYDSLDNKSFYKYNGNGQVIEENIYLSNGSLKNRNEYTYDSEGNLSEKKQFSIDGNMEQRQTFHYDDYHNVIELKVMLRQNDTDVYTYGYVYDDNNNWIQQIHYKNGKPTFMIERELVYYKADEIQ